MKVTCYLGYDEPVRLGRVEANTKLDKGPYTGLGYARVKGEYFLLHSDYILWDARAENVTAEDLIKEAELYGALDTLYADFPELKEVRV